ncbi:HlyC/CorC family transporter [Phototrophicus methaneseepsis]|uniref:HlyC/CorC family transporter n=1 Tax=Phototrophicus methaneseepsis TaxID=2710758 RepID=A0A7S8E9L2_9CHLR|nr:hemolysin family protein [Phototrophicus methaneseepsis]QPC82938.1 HlyC/CorC family transporter [Phototrophicus methaneseepsis]
MDDSTSGSLLGIAISIALYALLTLSYAALSNVRQSSLQEEAEEGNRRAEKTLALLKKSSQVGATYAVLTMALTFIIAVLASNAFLQPLVAATEVEESQVALGVLGMASVAALTIILGRSVPEGVGSSYADSIAMLFTSAMSLSVTLLSPLTRGLMFISRAVAGVFGGGQLVNTVTEEEILSLVNEGNTEGTIEDKEKEMIFSVLQLNETNVREVMTPRIDIVAVDVNTPLTEALDNFIDTGFSRLPVFEENIDNIVGLLYAKDLLNLWRRGGLQSDRTVREMVRPAYFVPETKLADELLRELQSRKVHMAIVVDEYGGTSGLVTIENLIEEIVGDIQDEYDYNEEEEYTRNGNGEYLIDASMDLDDFNELLEVHLQAPETDTLGGYIYMRLGHVPDEGEVIETDELTMTVLSIDGRRIRKVEVMRKTPPETDTENTETTIEDAAEASSSTEPPEDDDSSQPLADAS